MIWGIIRAMICKFVASTWIQVFHIKSASRVLVFDLWEGDDTLNDVNCLQTGACDQNYKSHLVNTWPKVDEVWSDVVTTLLLNQNSLTCDIYALNKIATRTHVYTT